MALDPVRTRPSLAARLGLALLSAAAALVVVELLFLLLARQLASDDPLRGFRSGDDYLAHAAWVRDAGRRGVVMNGQAHDPLLGWTNAPDLRDFVEPGHPPRSTNSAGMRGAREFERAPEPETVRVALIGDSFTFGTHQPDERIWARLLDEQLPGAEVLNFGVPGYGTDQALLMLEEQVLAWRPDVVVWCVFAENPARATREFSFYAKPRFAPAGPDAPLDLAPEGVPVPDPRTLLREGRPARGDAPYRPLLWTLLVGRPEEPAELDEVQLHAWLLERALARCAAADARLLVVGIPTRAWADQQPRAWEPVTAERLARADPDRARWVDARAWFRAADAADPAGATLEPIYIPGRHFSPRGHRVFAAALAAELRRAAWLDGDGDDAGGGQEPR